MLNAYWVFFLTLLITIIFLIGCRWYAKKHLLLIDIPNQRSSHASVVPRCGGIPIYLITLVGCLILFRPADLRVIGYLLGAMLISIIGTIDDVINLKGKPKIVGMVLSALMPLLFGLKLEYLSIVLNSQPALYILSFIWIYGFINALNFMDGIDGLVGGSAAIGAFFIMVLAALTGNVFVTGVALLLLAACLGFLAFNFNPASIFLGDAGSMFLGYNFAVLGIMLTNGSANAAPIYLTILIFAPLIYDSMVTFTRRGFQGKNVIEAHREHLYQRLIILGMSHRDVSLIYYALSLLFGLLALLYFNSNVVGRVALSIFALVIMVGFSLLVKRFEVVKMKKNDA